MSETCRYCGAQSVVPVLDKNIELKPTLGGNKYRRRCTSCERWSPMTSADHFESARDPHVLPLDGEMIVPLRDYDHGPELEELVERRRLATDDAPRAVATDGGTVDYAESDLDLEPEPDPDPENKFECPGCGCSQTGFPDECESCGAPYNW